MQDVNVLVVFCSRTGKTEARALAAALGAVQAKANIRLRWLREPADDRSIQEIAGWKENRERMEKEYIGPRTVDADWADAIIIGASGRPPELRDYLASLDDNVKPVWIGDGDPRLRGRQVADAARAVKDKSRSQSPASD